MHDSVDVPEAPSVTLAGLNTHESPDVGDTVEDRLMIPVNPPTEETVIVEFPVALARTVTLVGFAVTVKSFAATTLYVTMIEWDRLALVPVTIT